MKKTKLIFSLLLGLSGTASFASMYYTIFAKELETSLILAAVSLAWLLLALLYLFYTFDT